MYVSAVAAGDGRGDTGDTTLAVQGPNRAHNRTQVRDALIDRYIVLIDRFITVRERQTDANTNTNPPENSTTTTMRL